MGNALRSLLWKNYNCSDRNVTPGPLVLASSSPSYVNKCNNLSFFSTHDLGGSFTTRVSEAGRVVLYDLTGIESINKCLYVERGGNQELSS